jgi:polyphosphate kinase
MNIINRELSWLSFNERVLQESMDPTVPLTERMRFLGIYSNNMDEFFRVRVANLKRISDLKKQKVEGFNGDAEELYKEIRKVVMKQQLTFEKAFSLIQADFEKDQIFMINEKEVNTNQLLILKNYYNEHLKHVVFPIILDKKNPLPKLRDYAIYLAVKIVEKKNKTRFALIQIPSEYSRFYQLKSENRIDYILIDDIIRLQLKEIFSIFEPVEISAFTFKFTRDAELDLDDDLSLSFFEKIEKSLKQRRKGDPVRFVYDSKMPKDLLNFLLKSLDLTMGNNTIPGGRYHNFKDFMSFPDFGMTKYRFQPEPPQAHLAFSKGKSHMDVIFEQDVLLHFPYQKFDHVVDLLREAALDPKVKDIKINIYRVAKNSEVMNALLACVFNGKEVTVIFELQARFDEENNLWWSNRLKDYGANVIYGVPNLKVHSKLMQIRKVKDGKDQFITYVGTGNFNEKTATIYSDLAILSSERQLSLEVSKIFSLLENNMERHLFRNLLVSPFNTRRKIFALIDKEIAFAKAKKPANIKIKINNLTDVKMIDKLYAASKAGVKIELIVRGICCLKPGVKGLSDNITAISLVDRYLEHARFFIFENNGDQVHIITSADWMERNLDQRIEVGMIVKDLEIKAELDRIFDFQWRGSVKARNISADLKNRYNERNLPPFHAQRELYRSYLQE